MQNRAEIVNDTGAKCPKCGGKIIEKKSKRGRVFYGCDNYPKCDFVSWDAPSDKTCPVCGKVLLKKKDKAQTLYCVTPGCTYTFNKDDAGRKMENKQTVTVIGAGLAGSEAAWQIAQAGYSVRLFEMKPQKFRPRIKAPGLRSSSARIL